MGFQEFKNDYVKAIAPDNKVDMINSINDLIDKKSLSFFATQI
ncbi:unnamed protein product [marine sediment metagenome]|uniref:Uncharacterized protein n=1 Tax=marine sediment metagenome TaxID=412755 RepID=X1EC24_9ZZZZ